MVEFGSIDKHGNVRIIKTLRQSSMQLCPWVIMMPEHYRADETCRCNDPGHTEMAEWGYAWDGAKWIAGDEDEED